MYDVLKNMKTWIAYVWMLNKTDTVGKHESTTDAYIRVA